MLQIKRWGIHVQSCEHCDERRTRGQEAVLQAHFTITMHCTATAKIGGFLLNCLYYSDCASRLTNTN